MPRAHRGSQRGVMAPPRAARKPTPSAPAGASPASRPMSAWATPSTSSASHRTLPADTNPGCSTSQRPTGTWAWVSTRPSGSRIGRSAAAATGSAVPTMSPIGPGSEDPGRDTGGMLVASPDDDRAGRQAPRPGDLVEERPGDVGRRPELAEAAGSIAERVEELVRPGEPLDDRSAAGRRRWPRSTTRRPVRLGHDPRRRQQVAVRDGVEVVTEPGDLRRSVRRVGVRAGQLARIRSGSTRAVAAASSATARRSIQIGAGPSGRFAASTATIPSSWAAIPIRGAVRAGRPASADRVADRALYRRQATSPDPAPPSREPDGRPRGPGATPDDRALVVEEDRLRRLGPHVAADDEDGGLLGQSRMMTHRTRPAVPRQGGVEGPNGRADESRTDQPTGPGPRR